VQAKLRHGGAVTLAFVICLAALVWGDSGSGWPAPSSSDRQPNDLLSAPLEAGGPKRETYISHTWVIPAGRRSISVPILMYHYIRTPPSIATDRLGYNLSVSPADFGEQMHWLASHNYHPVTLNAVHAYFASRHALPSRPVVITLDDGYRDLYTTAFPILRAYNFKAVAFIVSGFVGKPGYVTAAQVVELGQQGIEIASHTVDHPDLAHTSLPMVMYELLASKAWLQRLLRHSVVDFAYPSGRFNAQVIAALYLTGYTTAVTTMSGTYHSQTDRYVWTRVRVGGGESLVDFGRDLGPVEKAVEITVIAVGPASA
jgi:peptidoglycan/xylan/chitin deacetylase (PgdA/CDA1 family)